MSVDDFVSDVTEISSVKAVAPIGDSKDRQRHNESFFYILEKQKREKKVDVPSYKPLLFVFYFPEHSLNVDFVNSEISRKYASEAYSFERNYFEMQNH